jgi:hypothetical protein
MRMRGGIENFLLRWDDEEGNVNPNPQLASQ